VQSYLNVSSVTFTNLKNTMAWLHFSEKALPEITNKHATLPNTAEYFTSWKPSHLMRLQVNRVRRRGETFF